MQNVNTSDDEREIEQEYQRFKKKQNRVSSICDKKIQEFEEQDYLFEKVHLDDLDLYVITFIALATSVLL